MVAEDSGLENLIKDRLPKDYPCIRSKRGDASLQNERFFENKRIREKHANKDEDKDTKG